MSKGTRGEAPVDMNISTLCRRSHVDSYGNKLEPDEFSQTRGETHFLTLHNPKQTLANASYNSGKSAVTGFSGKSRCHSEKSRESLSPSSVVDPICIERERTNKTPILPNNIVHLTPSHLTKSRERVQSFLKKTLYSPGADGDRFSKFLNRSSPKVAAERNEQRAPSNRPKAAGSSIDVKIRKTQHVASNVPKNERNLDRTPSKEQVGLTDSASEDGSTGSASSARSSSASADRGVIGICRPTYDAVDSFYIHPLVTVPAVVSPVTSPCDTDRLQSFEGPESDRIVAKKRCTSSLKVDTSFYLEAVSEEDDERPDSNSTGVLPSNNLNEEEVVFEEVDEETFSNPISSPERPTPRHSQLSLFDSPFTSPIGSSLFDEEDTLSIYKDRNSESGSIVFETAINFPTEQEPDTMQSLARFLQKNSGESRMTSGDDMTRCSASKASGRSVMSRRSVRVDQNAPRALNVESKDQACKASLVQMGTQLKSTEKSCNTQLADDSENSIQSTIKIFLLLVEPKTKVFELIQLLYPRKTTTIQDIIDMIPRNATEDVLARQQYVGLLRPKKRAAPITKLTLLASLHMQDRSTRSLSGCNVTADIMPGEVIVAVPRDSDPKVLVKLGKKILSNPHIQELVGTKENSDELKKVKKMKVKDINLPEYDVRCPGTPAKTRDIERNKNFVRGTKNREECSRFDDSLPNILDLEFSSGLCIPMPVKNSTHAIDRYDKEMKRALEHAALSNSASDCGSITPQSDEDVLPRLDALDAFILPRSDRSSSITSRETRTTFADNDSCRRESFTTNTADDTSFTESIESSFNSWSRSFDSSVLTRYSVTEISEKVTKPLIALDSIADVYDVTSSRHKMKRLSKPALRLLSGVSMFLILRYFADTENGFFCVVAVQRRLEIPFEPLGISGLLYLVISFSCLVKLQRIMQNRSQGQIRIDNCDYDATRCPFTQASSDIYKLVLTPP